MPRSLVNLIDEIGLDSRINTLEGAASTVKNYIPNATFNSNTSPVPGWSLFNTTIDSTTKRPTGGITAGSTIDTFSVDGNAPIAGAFSLLVESASGTWQSGHGFISDAFTIDVEDKSKVLGFSFSYRDGAQGGPDKLIWNGNSTNTLAVYIYDVTNSSWIQPAGVYNLIQGVGTGLCSGTFQTTSNSTQYRFAVLAINESPTIYSVLFDSFQLGPQKVVYGAPVTDWVDYTPTGTWNTNVTYNGKWRRVGDSMEIRARVLCSGAPNAVGLGINLPSGYSIDTNKLASVLAGGTPLGYGQAVDVGSASYPVSLLYFGSTTQLGVYDGVASGTYLVNTNVTNTAPFTFGSTDFVEVISVVPILGWSSTVQMSNDTDTRVVAAKYSGGSSAYGAGAVLQYNTKDFDTHNAVTTGASWAFLAPVSGYYSILFSATRSTSGTQSHLLYKNGTTLVQFVLTNVVGTTSYNSGGTTVYLNAGETITIKTDNAATIEVGYISIERLSGPATIAASEKLTCSYNTSTSVIVGSGTWSQVTYTNKVVDTHAIYNTSTGVATIPVSGVYKITHQMRSKNALGAGQYLSVHFTKNGISFNENLTFAIRAGAAAMLSDTVGPATWVGTLLAGDLIRFSMDSNSASNGPTTTVIEQVGNMFTIQLI